MGKLREIMGKNNSVLGFENRGVTFRGGEHWILKGKEAAAVLTNRGAVKCHEALYLKALLKPKARNASSIQQEGHGAHGSIEHLLEGSLGEVHLNGKFLRCCVNDCADGWYS